MSMLKSLSMACLALVAALLCNVASAQADPPTRAGRLTNLQGSVSVYDWEQGAWAPALSNRPITSGDRVSTGPDSRAEVRVGSTVMRLGARTELEVARIDDERLQFQLHSGSAGLRVRSRAAAEEVEVFTPEAHFRPLRAGHYRFDRDDDVSFAGTLHGELLVDESQRFAIAAGQRMEFWRTRGQANVQQRWSAPPSDAMSAWLAAEDQREERTAASRYVSPEMTGAEDLDRYGRWDRHPEFGAIWIPLNVQIGWAPYRFGRWVSISPWGWTWVDAQPWGFAPFHYGRWVQWRDTWCWAPGVYVPRPVFAPALVAWIGAPRAGVSIGTGGGVLPGSQWVPLAPREAYRPHYVASPRHVDQINEQGHWRRDGREGGEPRSPRERRDQRDQRDQRDPVRTTMPVSPGSLPRSGGYANQGVPGVATQQPPQPPQQPRHGGQPIAIPVPAQPAAVAPSVIAPAVPRPAPTVLPPAPAAPPIKPPNARPHERENDDGRARTPESRPGQREREVQR